MVQDLFSKPIWCQFCPKLGGPGFRSQLVHFFPGPGSGPGSIFSSSSAMCGHHVSQFGRIILILIKFPKQRLSLGCTPHQCSGQQCSGYQCRGHMRETQNYEIRLGIESEWANLESKTVQNFVRNPMEYLLESKSL